MNNNRVCVVFYKLNMQLIHTDKYNPTCSKHKAYIHHCLSAHFMRWCAKKRNESAIV